MISIAVSLFNIEKMEYDWEPALSNFINFGDELVINVNDSEDNTSDLIVMWGEEAARKWPEKGLQIVFSGFSYDDPNLDGLCKNNAVQNCTQQFIILIDIDERLILSQRPQWERLALEYIQKDKVDCILMPSLNCWGSEEKAKNIGQKWYIQRQGIERGVVNFARKKDGTHDIEKSDGTEPLLDKDGNLPRSLILIPQQMSDYEKIVIIKQNNLPYVVHLGDVDLEKRIERNQLFWKKHWETESGREITNVPIKMEDLPQINAFDHGLETKNPEIQIKEIENNESVSENQTNG